MLLPNFLAGYKSLPVLEGPISNLDPAGWPAEDMTRLNRISADERKSNPVSDMVLLCFYLIE